MTVRTKTKIQNFPEFPLGFKKLVSSFGVDIPSSSQDLRRRLLLALFKGGKFCFHCKQAGDIFPQRLAKSTDVCNFR